MPVQINYYLVFLPLFPQVSTWEEVCNLLTEVEQAEFWASLKPTDDTEDIITELLGDYDILL